MGFRQQSLASSLLVISVLCCCGMGNNIYKNQDNERGICGWCQCHFHTKSVICTSLPFKPPKLVKLPFWVENLSTFNITMIELPHFEDHKKLRELRINHCGLKRIDSLSFVTLSNLEVLNFADNLIEELPELLLQPLHHLRVLNLARNKISDLTRLNLHTSSRVVLEVLNLNGNSLQFANEKIKLPKVKRLYMENANIAKINANGMGFKTQLSINSTKLLRGNFLSLDEEFWKVIENFNIGENREMEVDSSIFPMFSSLKSLKLSKATVPLTALLWINSDTNRIHHLDINSIKILESAEFNFPFEALGDEDISPKTWTFCGKNLEWLDISGIGTIDTIRLNSFCRIKWLYANRNKIRRVLVDGNELQTLYLDHNALVELPLVEKSKKHVFKNLQYLSLVNNSIEESPETILELFPGLQSLNLASNKLPEFLISSKEDEDNSKLKSINLSNNKLSRFDLFATLQALNVLDLSHNNLAHFSFQTLIMAPSLQNLHLSNNLNILIETLNIVRNFSLKELDLRACSLMNKMPDLSMFSELQMVDLSQNSLSGELDGHFLPKKIQNVSFRKNYITKVGNFSRLQLEEIQLLDIGMNPLDCKCGVQTELLKIVKKQEDFHNGDEYYCFENKRKYSLAAHLTLENLADCIQRSERPNDMIIIVILLLSLISGTIITLNLLIKKHKHHCSYELVSANYDHEEYPCVDL